MALLAVKFQEDILISLYSSVVPLLESLSLLLPLEELKEAEFHSHNLINHFIKKKGRNDDEFFLLQWYTKQNALLKREVWARVLGMLETKVLVNVMK